MAAATDRFGSSLRGCVGCGEGGGCGCGERCDGFGGWEEREGWDCIVL